LGRGDAEGREVRRPVRPAPRRFPVSVRPGALSRERGAVVEDGAPDRRTSARRSLVLFLSLVALASAFLEWTIARTGRPIEEEGGLIFALMWTPALASLVCRVVFREGIRDVSFRFGGRRAVRPLLTAWLLPVAVGAVAYGAAWLLGLARFELPDPAKFGIA